MIEDHALWLILLMLAVPCLLGIGYAIITRPSSYYYVHGGTRWKKKRYK